MMTKSNEPSFFCSAAAMIFCKATYLLKPVPVNRSAPTLRESAYTLSQKSPAISATFWLVLGSALNNEPEFTIGPRWRKISSPPVFCKKRCRNALMVVPYGTFSVGSVLTKRSSPSMAIERLHCGSKSISNILLPLLPNASARFQQIVDLPTPPLLLNTEISFAILFHAPNAECLSIAPLADSIIAVLQDVPGNNCNLQ